MENLIQQITVNFAIAFNAFKDILFNKKVLRHKMKRIQGKKHKMNSKDNNFLRAHKPLGSTCFCAREIFSSKKKKKKTGLKLSG